MLFSGTSDFLSQIVKPLVNSSNDFSPLVISFQRPLFLYTSSWLSSTLFLSLSSPLNTFELVLTHLTLILPVHFLLSTVEITQLQIFLFGPVESPFYSIMVFIIPLCYYSRVIYYHLILLASWFFFKNYKIVLESKYPRETLAHPFIPLRSVQTELLNTIKLQHTNVSLWCTNSNGQNILIMQKIIAQH